MSSLGFHWGIPGGHGPHSGLALPGPCPAEIMYRLLGLQPVLKGPRPHNTALWLPQDTMGLVVCPRVVRKGSVSSLTSAAPECGGVCQFYSSYLCTADLERLGSGTSDPGKLWEDTVKSSLDHVCFLKNSSASFTPNQPTSLKNQLKKKKERKETKTTIPKLTRTIKPPSFTDIEQKQVSVSI